LPWQVIIGPRNADNGVVEVKNRHTGEAQEMSAEQAIAMLAERAGAR